MVASQKTVICFLMDEVGKKYFTTLQYHSTISFTRGLLQNVPNLFKALKIRTRGFLI